MKKIRKTVLFEGRWLRLVEGEYENSRGEMCFWEYIEREKAPDSVVIVAKLMPSERYILTRQYRHPIDRKVIGLPAGLIDGGVGNILSELKEETGYTGRITGLSPDFKTNTGLMDSTSRIVFVEVDENDPVNADPSQSLEPEEEIEVILVKKEDIKAFLEKEEALGSAIGIGPWILFCSHEYLR